MKNKRFVHTVGTAAIILVSPYAAWAGIDVPGGHLSGSPNESETGTFIRKTQQEENAVQKSVNMQEGQHIVNVAEPFMFYDDGGADGKIGSRISATYTFVPSQAGQTITLDTESFSIGNGRMYVYSGREADENCLLGTKTGYSTTNGPSGLVSKAADGSITITVTGPSGATLNGFAMLVGVRGKVDYSLESAVASAAGTDTGWLRGSRDVPVLKVDMTIAGDMGGSKLSDFSFSMDGTESLTDVKALHLYATGDVEGFSPAIARKLATVEPAGTDVCFRVEDATGDFGKFHYWLTADLADDAVAGHNIGVSFKSVKFNGEVCAGTGVKRQATVKAGLKGVFSVGAGGDYSDFAAMTAALSGGIEGEVIFEILDGTYPQNIKIADVKGSSADHPLVIRSKSGDRDAVTLSGKFSSAEKSGIVQISGTPFVRIEGITVSSSSSSWENLVYVADGSHSFTLKDCSIAGPVISGNKGTNLLRSKAKNEAGFNNDDMTVENCSFLNGLIAVYLGGTGFVALPKEKGLRINGNVIDGAYSKGIYVSDEVAPVISGNVVSASAHKNGYQAIDLYRVSGGAVVERNRLINSGSSYSTGIDLRDACKGEAGSPIRIVNNEIAISKCPAYTGRALNINNLVSNVDVAYNTLRVEGTNGYVLATNGSGSASGIKVRGNIIHNDCSTGSIGVYFWNKTDVAGFSFSNNAFHSRAGVVCKNDSEQLDFNGFTALTGDASSINEKAEFLAAEDSHPASAGGLRCGEPVEGIATDLEGTARPATDWTLGAYEYAEQKADKPEIATGYPKVMEITESSAVVKTKWDMGGKLYSIVREWKEGDILPEAETVAGGTGVSISANVEVRTGFQSLKSSTDYRAFFVAESPAGVRGDVVATDVFTTAQHIDPLEVEFAETDIPRVEAGAEYVFVPVVSGGLKPYTYIWKDQMNRQAGTESTLTMNPDVAGSYTLTVESADGQKATATASVEVDGELVPAMFDDNFLESESHFTPEGEHRFYSGSFAFNSDGMPEYSFWYGYTLSSETSSQFTTIADQFRSAPGGAFAGSNFVVAYPQGMTIDVTNSEEGDVVPGCYVANSAYAYSSMRNGDGFAKPFADGSWFKVTAIGTDASGNRKSADFYLGDWRDSNADEHYILNGWEWFDLRSLGKVKSVTFNFDGSDKGSFGVNTPTYVCLDRFGAMPEMETESVSIADGSSIDLADLFVHDASSTASEVYSLEVLEDGPFTLSLDGSDVRLDGNGAARAAAGQAVCMASMRRAGHTDYLRLVVKEDKGVGVDRVYTGDVRLYPVPVTDRLNVSTELEDYTVEIYSSTGMRVYASEGNSGNITISRDGWSAGVYAVRITSVAGTSVHRVIVK